MLHCGTHPWDIKTTIFSFRRPETSHGWDPDTKVDRSLQTLVHNTTYAHYTLSFAFIRPCSLRWRRSRRPVERATTVLQAGQSVSQHK
jgi:hypothetical protein